MATVLSFPVSVLVNPSCKKLIDFGTSTKPNYDVTLAKGVRQMKVILYSLAHESLQLSFFEVSRFQFQI